MTRACPKEFSLTASKARKKPPGNYVSGCAIVGTFEDANLLPLQNRKAAMNCRTPNCHSACFGVIME